MQIDFIHDHARAEWDGGMAEQTARQLYRRLAPLLRRHRHGTRLIGNDHPAVRRMLDSVGLECGAARQWPALFSGADAGGFHAALTRAVAGSDLVVGFELSPNQLEALHGAGAAVLDVAIDTVRFAPDLFLGLRTNHPGLARRLAAAAIPDAAIPRPPTLLGPRPAAPPAMFVGQTDIDAALVRNGRLMVVDGFLPGLRARFGDGAGLVLKPHPYGRVHHDVRTLHAAFPRARMVTDNVYALLASRSVAEVVTLSSGVAVEAGFFGVPATRLLPPGGAEVAGMSPRYRVAHSDLPGLIVPAVAAARGDEAAAAAARGGKAAATAARGGATLRSLLGLAWAYPPPTQLPSRRVAAGDVFDIRAGTPPTRLQAFGWSHPEATGAWTEGTLATLLVDPGGQALELAMRCHAFVPPGAGRLRVEVRTAGGPPVPLAFGSGWSRTITVALPAVAGPVEVALHIGNPRSPADAGVSNDRRALGVHLSAVRVRAAAASRAVWNAAAFRTMAASILTALMGG